MAVATDVLRRSIKAQMKDANRTDAVWTITIGDDELANGTCVIKHMATGEQQTVPQQTIEEHLRR